MLYFWLAFALSVQAPQPAQYTSADECEVQCAPDGMCYFSDQGCWYEFGSPEENDNERE